MYKLIIKTILPVLFILLLAGNTFAASTDLSIRLAQPKSPTNQDTFGITFVSLDILDRAIIVRCFKKGPSDGAYSQFGGDIAVSAGGNTGTCDVNSSVINTSGTYNFYATATAGSDNATSLVTSVDFNTGGPGTPVNFSKNRITSCQYQIKYRTADDSGKTVKVELYRSDNSSFSADSGTRVASHALSSNTDDTFDNFVPDCSKEYFYVVRAFDTYGNGSGLAGDSSVTITTTSTSTTVTQPTTTPGQGAIPAGNESGNVVGEAEAAGNEETQAQELTAVPEVKGAEVEAGKEGILGLLSNRYVQWGLGIAGVLALLFLFYKLRQLKKI